MRKNVLGLIALFVVAIVAAWNVSLNSQNNKLSGLSLANIEALAEGNEEENNKPTWQVGEKTIQTTTSPGWEWDVSVNGWFFNGKRTSSKPPEITTVKIKCCRAQGDVTSCSYESC
ncbi:MAG: NVEALA domain-containing protein [Prevotellaceae bacterium]|jgi:hypothetical protein|nr:NVEALA domain-containing protein [Prevotellaceae bacterium]